MGHHGDLNGDGKPDLALLSSDVIVLTNNGSGGFATFGSYSVGPTPYAVVAADVDGSADLITCNQGNNTLTVLTNKGSGLFGFNATLTVGSGPEALTTADVNGDGRADLISGNWNDGALTVLTNAATFLPRLTIRRSGNKVLVSWLAAWVNWSLKQNASLATNGWGSFNGTIGNDGITVSACPRLLHEASAWLPNAIQYHRNLNLCRNGWCHYITSQRSGSRHRLLGFCPLSLPPQPTVGR